MKKSFLELVYKLNFAGILIFQHALIKLTNLKVDAESKEIPQVEYFYSGRRVTSKKELARLEKYLRRLDDMYFI